MPQSRVPFSATVDPTTLEVLDEIAEERDESRSGTVDAVVEEWVQQQQEIEGARQELGRLREQLDAERERAEQAEQERRELAEQVDDSGGGSASTLGIVCAVLGPVLLAVGELALGAPFLLLGALYVGGWVTGYNQHVDNRIAAGRAELADHGGLRGFFLTTLASTLDRLPSWLTIDPAIDDPTTSFERAANVEQYIPVAFGVGVVVALPVVIAYYTGSTEAFVQALGVWGTLGYILLLTGALYLIPVIAGVAAIASLAISTARDADEEGAPNAEGS